VSDATAVERREVYYSGRVQGVGFRFTVMSIARKFDVAGFVRNLPDGRVELVAEGRSGEIRALLEAVAEHMRYYIAEVQEETVPAAGELDGFTVRY